MRRHWVLALTKEEHKKLEEEIIKLRVEESLDIKTISERKQLSRPYVTGILKKNNINTSRIKQI